MLSPPRAVGVLKNFITLRLSGINMPSKFEIVLEQLQNMGYNYLVEAVQDRSLQDTDANKLVNIVYQYIKQAPVYRRLQILSEDKWLEEVGESSEDKLLGGTAAIVTPQKDILVREGFEDAMLHELLHTAGFMPDGISNFINEGITQLITEELSKLSEIKVHKSYKDQVKFVNRYIMPLISSPLKLFAIQYAKAKDKSKFIVDEIWVRYSTYFEDVDDWGKNPYHNFLIDMRRCIGTSPYLEYLVKEIKKSKEVKANNRIGAITQIEKIKNLKPTDELIVYHGTSTSFLLSLINGFDTLGITQGHYSAPHKGLFVSTDFDVAKKYAYASTRYKACVIQIKVKAKFLHGTDTYGNTEKTVLKKDMDYYKELYPNCFNPFLAFTLLNGLTTEALLIGLVRPDQIIKIWKDNKWYDRKQFIETFSELIDDDNGIIKLHDIGHNLADPNISIEDAFEIMYKFYKSIGQEASLDEIKENIEYIVKNESEDYLIKVLKQTGFSNLVCNKLLPKIIQYFNKKVAEFDQITNSIVNDQEVLHINTLKDIKGNNPENIEVREIHIKNAIVSDSLDILRLSQYTKIFINMLTVNANNFNDFNKKWFQRGGAIYHAKVDKLLLENPYDVQYLPTNIRVNQIIIQDISKISKKLIPEKLRDKVNEAYSIYL